MSDLVIATQFLENYSGNWKPKGGDEYVVPSVDVNNAQALVAEFESNLMNNEFCRETVIGWVVEDSV